MIISIENLSNEIFYEIFDYLDGCDIYKSFSNLNYRFYRILHSSLLLHKIKFHFKSNDLFIKNYQYLQYLNRHQIFSLNLSSELYIDKFFSSFNIDSSLDHLQFIYLQYIQPETLSVLLKKCIYLPCLTTLNILSYHQSLDLCQIYPLIFTLPKLKYLKIVTHEFKNSVPLSYASENQQLSTIEYLNIQHRVTFSELAAIISYTPKLYRLKFSHEDEDDPTVDIISTMELSKLTHLSMTIVYLKFDDTNIFLRKLPSTLKSLNFYVCEPDLKYLDFCMWKELIQENLPQLEEFYFHYNLTITDDDDEEFIFSDCICNQFISPFWINRRWFVEVMIRHGTISIIMKPYRKRWYEFIPVDTKLDPYHSTLLTIRYVPSDEYIQTLFDEIEWITDLATIYHLEIYELCFIGNVIEIFNLLPYLDSLKISSITLPTETLLTMNELEEFNDAANHNDITKVYLEKMNTFDDVLFLIDLFPQVEYLQIGCTSDVDIQLFLQVIFKKMNDKGDFNLHLLAVRIPIADDQMVKQIQNMITFDGLLFDYKVTRTNDTISLLIEQHD
ncbi:hypothetical protein I4U23_003908 [Adineta vaga]|nr:hypothetical protein I4U23_003908 [Adineta vaga]